MWKNLKRTEIYQASQKKLQIHKNDEQQKKKVTFDKPFPGYFLQILSWKIHKNTLDEISFVISRRNEIFMGRFPEKNECHENQIEDTYAAQ